MAIIYDFSTRRPRAAGAPIRRGTRFEQNRDRLIRIAGERGLDDTEKGELRRLQAICNAQRSRR